MKRKTIVILIGFSFFTILMLLSQTAEAGIRLWPPMLNCPEARAGETVDCGTIALQNNNRLLGISVRGITIGNTEEFTLDTSDCVGRSLSAGRSCTIGVTFHPVEGGGYYTTVVARYKYLGFLPEHRVHSEVYGLGTFPIARLSTNELDFGEQTINTSHRQYVRLENIGTATLNISSMSIPLGSGFSSEDDCGSELAAENSCGILIYFEPTEAIEYLSTMEIIDDAYNSPQQIALSGTGINPGQPDIHIEKTQIRFGDQALDSVTTETITLTSTGTVDLDFTSITASGDTFSQTNDCPATLAPDESCTLSVSFEPTVAGFFEGTVTLVDNANDSPQTITLSGKGVSPNATLLPGLVDFGNQTIGRSSIAQEVILYNSGTSALTIQEISTSSALYTQTNSCDETLDAKQSCTILVTFTPIETGASSATLTVASDDPSSPAKAFLFGNGITGPDLDIAPPLFDFGKTPVGETSEQKDFTLKNTGEGDLDLDAITVNSDFAQENDCPASLAEEETCVVEATFSPETAGNFFGNLTIVDNAEGSPHKAHLMGYGTNADVTLLPAGIDFGQQTVGRSSLPHDVRLLNSGNEAISIESIASSSALFAQTNDCGATLAPAAFCTITITFTPTSTDDVTAEITIVDSAAGSPHNVDLMGSGIDPVYPDLDIAPKHWDFGQTLVGETSEAKAFTVKNTGVVDVVIAGIDANSEFAQVNDCPETLASDETCTITGTFVPQAAGEFTGHITVIDNTASRYQSVVVQGTASHSGSIDVSFSASVLDFGDVLIFSSSDSQSVIMTNAGSNDVTVGAVTIAENEASEFNMTTNCANRSLDVGASCLIDVLFAPLSAGAKTANILIYDDAHDSPQAISLTGTGTTGSSGCALAGGSIASSASGGALLAALLGGLSLVRRRMRHWE